MDKVFERRLEKARDEMKKENLRALLVSDPYSVWYLSGIWNEPYERMYVLYIEETGKPKLFVNFLFNVPQSAEDDFDEFWFSDSDDYVSILSENTASGGRIGVDKTWPAKFLIPLMKSKGSAEFVVGSGCIDSLREKKDEEEIALMREASRINDLCIEKGFGFIKAGVTEKEVADYIRELYKWEGADGESFETIVSFGANAADPHHSPDGTVVKEGDCVLIDMGCRKNHYCSDMTRTAFFKSADEDSKKIHDIVRLANEAAESIVRPGVPLRDIDRAARNLIEKSGYGKYFTHRLGHFIGQTDHEAGDVSSANRNLAEEGMIFSIEPGIYLPGKTGVRIEDLILVTKNGAEVLNHVDKKWRIIG